MNWQIKSFQALTAGEIYKILQLRSEVFIVEQNCIYQDIDDKDLKALHLWCNNSEGKIVAYCRLLPADISYKEPSIGRVATFSAFRNKGLGRLMMQRAIAHIRDEWNYSIIRISAQLYLKQFYISLNFEQVSDIYQEDGIAHIEMLMKNT